MAHKDHAAEAEKHLNVVNPDYIIVPGARTANPDGVGLATLHLQMAHTEATLALVEQQRIANLMDYLRLIDERPGPEDDRQIREGLGL